MLEEKKSGGGILIVVLLLTTLIFIYTRYLYFQKLHKDCFSNNIALSTRLDSGVMIDLFYQSSDDEICLLLLDTLTYQFPEGNFKKYLHPQAHFYDFLIKNQEKIVFVKVD